MVLAVVYLVVGAAVLMMGAGAATRAAGHFALERAMSAQLLGTLFFGVDLGSLATVLVAAGRGQTTIAVGAALGTTLLLSVGLGLALLAANEPVPSPGRPVILLAAAALVLGAAALANEQVARLEGAALLLAYVAYLVLLAQEGRVSVMRGEHIQRVAAARRSLPPAGVALFGLALVFLGAMVLVGGGVRLAGRAGMTVGFVGAAIVGALASFDETILVVVRVRRGASDPATAHLFGAIAAVPTGMLGLAALVRPLVVDPAAWSAFLAAAVLYTVVATAFLAGNRVWRRTGLALVVLYGVWVAIASRL